jgi:hypothetical protein
MDYSYRARWFYGGGCTSMLLVFVLLYFLLMLCASGKLEKDFGNVEGGAGGSSSFR